MSRLEAYWRGLASVPSAAGWLLRHRSVWLWALLPWLVQLSVCALSLTVIAAQWPQISAWLHAQLPDWTIARTTWSDYPVAAMAWVAHLFLSVVCYFLALLLLVTLAVLLGQLCAGPLWELFAERVARQLGLPAPPHLPWWPRTRHAFGAELVKLAGFGAIPLLLLPLQFIPVVGSALGIVATTVFSIWALGYAFVDYALLAQQYEWRKRWHFARYSAATLAGIGTLAAVPGAAILGAPFFIVAGVRCYAHTRAESLRA